MRITRKLNIVHTIHFSLILSVVFVINFFVLKEVIYQNLFSAMNSMSIHLMHYIDSEVKEIKQAAASAAYSNGTSSVDKNIALENIKRLHPGIVNISIVERNYSVYDYNKIEWKDNSATVPLDSNHEAIVDLEEGWFSNLLVNFRYQGPYSIIVFDSANKVWFTNDSVSLQENDAITYEELLSILMQKGDDDNDLKNLKLFKNGSKYLANVSFNDNTGTCAVIYISNNNIFRFLRHYPIVITLIFIFELAFLLSMVIRTNRRYTRPLLSAIASLKKNNGASIINSSESDEVMLVKKAIDSMQNQIEFYTQNLEKVKIDSKKIEKDIQLAKLLQKNILPKNVGEIKQKSEFEIYATSEAAFDLGGDLYDYFMLDDTHLMFAIADIAGKGIPASLFTIFTHTLLRTVAKPELTVSEITTQLNDKLIENNISDLFVTMILGVLDITNGELTFCNAAHNSPLLIKENGTFEEIKDVHGIPLGIYANREYKSSTIQLNENDQLLLYTDGLIDAKDENGMQFSMDVLKYNLMGAWFANPSEVVEKINSGVTSFRGTADPVDDITVMALKFIHRSNNT